MVPVWRTVEPGACGLGTVKADMVPVWRTIEPGACGLEKSPNPAHARDFPQPARARADRVPCTLEWSFVAGRA